MGGDSVVLFDLWLPIVISSVAVFFASFLAHMVLPHHKSDCKGVPGERSFLNTLRSSNVGVGFYFFPFVEDFSELKDPEKKKKYFEGPTGYMCVFAGPMNMGKNLLFTFIFYLVVGVFVAYITSLACDAGAEYLSVFRVAGAVAVASYCLGFIPGSIWFRRPISNVVKDVIDGIVYALLTAGIFAWLWPGA